MSRLARVSRGLLPRSPVDSRAVGLALKEVSAIARELLRQHQAYALELDGVTTAESTSERVEILLSFERGDARRSRFVISVARENGEDFRVDFRHKLHLALRRHLV